MNVVRAYFDEHVAAASLGSLGGVLQRARLVAAPDVSPEKLRESLGPEFSIRTIPFGDRDGTCTIAWRGLSVLPVPCRGSPHSDAWYWMAHSLPAQRSLLLLQYLPEHRKTSAHRHVGERAEEEGEEETFYALAGSCLLTVGHCRPNDTTKAVKTTTVRLEEDDALVVPPGLAHQLTTIESPALNLIAIRNTRARTLQQLCHQYVTWVKDTG